MSVSCARTDAKTQNRDLQMKYDIAKNEDGPLRRTMKAGASVDTGVAASSALQNESSSADASDYPNAVRYPGLDERLQNIEKHFAVRYGVSHISLCPLPPTDVFSFIVPGPPRSLLDRLQFLEDHIVHLEREYPPWAALHFNQPNRGVSADF